MAPPIKVEYAKSARSRCTLKQCNLFIQKGELRIGTGSMMPGADELSYKWRHLCCFTARQIKNMQASVDNIEGFEEMEDEHQAIIHKMLKGQLENDASVKGAVISAAVAAAAATATQKPAGKAKKAPGVGALLMGNSSGDLSPATAPAAKLAGKKRPTRAELTTIDGFLVDCGAESDATDDYEVGVTSQKAACPFGADCYHKRPEHFERYSHPGDADTTLPNGKMEPTVIKRIVRAPTNAAAVSVAPPAPAPSPPPQQQGMFGAFSSSKQPCPYGEMCVLKTPAHLAQYSHAGDVAAANHGVAAAPPMVTMIKKVPAIPRAIAAPVPAAAPVFGGASKGPCPYLPMCLRSDAKHMAEYDH